MPRERTPGRKPGCSPVQPNMSPLQMLLIEAYFAHDGSVTKIMKELGRTEMQVHRMLSQPKIQSAIALRNKWMLKTMTISDDFTITKADRLKLLWRVAERGAQFIYDKEGNQVMSNAPATVSAIRTINEMVPGSVVPQEIQVNVAVEDNRSEAEIRESIAKLTGEYTKLLEVDKPQPKTIEYSKAEVVEDVDSSRESRESMRVESH